ncbi:hypothetical protein [Aneurinibacillus terranovensis]|nr:hypothetical protein [Aneurinibacillus terranovensis]
MDFFREEARVGTILVLFILLVVIACSICERERPYMGAPTGGTY